MINLNNQTVLLQQEPGQFIEALQFSPTSMTLELVNVFVGKGQRVSLHGEIWIQKEKFELNCSAEIIGYQVVANSCVQFEFKLDGDEMGLWEKFIQSKKSSQVHVDQLLQKMKGEI